MQREREGRGELRWIYGEVLVNWATKWLALAKTCAPIKHNAPDLRWKDVWTCPTLEVLTDMNRINRFQNTLHVTLWMWGRNAAALISSIPRTKLGWRWRQEAGYNAPGTRIPLQVPNIIRTLCSSLHENRNIYRQPSSHFMSLYDRKTGPMST